MSFLKVLLFTHWKLKGTWETYVGDKENGYILRHYFTFN